ncbi:MYG1 family protein [Patescibacteria group bacterium]
MKKIRIVTHSNKFHADEVCSVSTLKILLEKKEPDAEIEIIRTHDPEIIKTGDFVVDVGGEYSPEKKIFDHHQKGGAGERENKIPYSSFGLVWKEYGLELAGSQEAFELIDKRMVQPIDAMDNGVSVCKNIYKDISPYLFFNAIIVFRPTWKEEDLSEDEQFNKIVPFAVELIKREIKTAKDEIEGRNLTEEIYQKSEDKRLIIIDQNYPWEFVMSQYPEPLFVVTPTKDASRWKVNAVRDNPFSSFENRKDLPKGWGGKRDEDLQEVTGVSDAIFCHNNLFLVVAKSKEGAIKLAKIALENNGK